MADHKVAFMLQTLLTMIQMLVQHLQLLYHNHQQQVDMKTYMNYYMLLNPPRRINRRATMATMLGGSSSLLLVYFVAEVQRHLQARHMYYSVSSGSSGLVWTDKFLEPSSPCKRGLSILGSGSRLVCVFWGVSYNRSDIPKWGNCDLAVVL